MNCNPKDEAFDILQAVREARRDFGGSRSKKYVGAVTVEILREYLDRHGLTVSERDVFVRAVPVEVDLLLTRQGAKPAHGILYDPQDVLFALEVKACGAFGESTAKTVRGNFERLRQAGVKRCAYVTLWERQDYKWAVTKESLGGNFDAYTLFRHSGKPEALTAGDATGDLERLLSALRAAAREAE